MITNISNLEIAAYREIHCYQYIIKPFVKDAVLSVLKKLPEEFVQCHRMYVINLSYLEYFDFVNQVVKLKGYGQTIEIGGTVFDNAIEACKSGQNKVYLSLDSKDDILSVSTLNYR